MSCWEIYSRRFDDIDTEVCYDVEGGKSPTLYIDLAFYGRIRRLERVAIIMQYQLAYLSTLGGAYHLCDRPEVALVVARRQEVVGRYIGSSQIVIRALVFQAINHRMLGHVRKSQSIFLHLRKEPMDDQMVRFTNACESWLIRNFPIPQRSSVP